VWFRNELSSLAEVSLYLSFSFFLLETTHGHTALTIGANKLLQRHANTQKRRVNITGHTIKLKPFILRLKHNKAYTYFAVFRLDLGCRTYDTRYSLLPPKYLFLFTRPSSLNCNEYVYITCIWLCRYCIGLPLLPNTIQRRLSELIGPEGGRLIKRVLQYYRQVLQLIQQDGL